MRPMGADGLLVDVEALRDYLLDLCGTAMFSGLDLAVLDIVDVERADEFELVCIAERFGFDVGRFSTR